MKGYILALFLLVSFTAIGQTGIGTATPNASAQLDVVSTSRGILIPRMSKTQRNAISSPAAGLLVYQNTDSTGFYFYNGLGWVYLHAGILSIANGGTGATTAAGARDSLGLGNVDNTSDMDKPVSTATITALNSLQTYVDYFNSNLSYDLSNKADKAELADYLKSSDADNSYVKLSTNQSIDGVKTFQKKIVAAGEVDLGTGGTGNAGRNTAVGYNALIANTSGNGANTAVGFNSMHLNTSGKENTALGVSALDFNTTGSNNVATGHAALGNNTTGNYNTASGDHALFSNTTGNVNTAVGTNALLYGNIGDGNTAIGAESDMTQSKKVANATAIGYQAVADDSNMIQLGNSSVKMVRTSGKVVASGVVALGTGGGNIGDNTAVGNDVLNANVGGNGNTAVGYHSMQTNISGTYNTALGNNSLKDNSTGVTNTAIGSSALEQNQTGNDNTAIGFDALLQNKAGSNSAMGSLALGSNTTGTYNTAVGIQALISNVKGSYNTSIGSFANVSMATDSLVNATAIGAYAIVDSSNMIQLGDNNVNLVRTPGRLKLGSIFYPNTDGTNGQLLSTDGAGTLSWISPFSLSLGAISGTSTVNGASITDGVLNLAPADATNGGVVTTGSQTFEGVKTFQQKILAANQIEVGVGAGAGGGYGENTAIGYNVLNSNSSGDGGNTAVGHIAMGSTTTGAYNAALGNAALTNNTSGYHNTALGRLALSNNVIGSKNTAIGAEANVSQNDLENATAIGYNAIADDSNMIQLGNNDVTLVRTAGKIVAANQVEIGVGAGGGEYGENTAVGYNVLNANNSGDGANTAVGASAMELTTSGSWNAALGASALRDNTEGSRNTAIGRSALAKNTTGNQNTASGVSALYYNTIGDSNCVFGVEAMNYNNEGKNNVAVGHSALYTSNGNLNTALGHSALYVSNGNMNTALGALADVSEGNLQNATAIGYNAKADDNNMIQLGNDAVTLVRTSGTIKAGDVIYPNSFSGASSGDVLTYNGTTLVWQAPPNPAMPTGTAIREAADEFKFSGGRTVFTLSQTPASGAKVKVFVNGLRVSNGFYTVSGQSLTCNSTSLVLKTGDLIQIDYFY